MNILVFNGGSSSLKFKLIRIDPDGGEAALIEDNIEVAGQNEMGDALAKAVQSCQADRLEIDAVAHRVVHGGPIFREPALVTPDVIQQLKSLRELDPLHNPSEVALIEASRRLLPDCPIVAAFDTAFHADLPEIAWRYALPREFSDRLKLRRYGFHGLSFQYVTGRLLANMGKGADGTRLIICHLGSGASVCAVANGRSVDTSMGMTPLEGLVMGTRSGDIDPGLIVYLLRENKIEVERLDSMLNKESGLLGLSGLSGDIRKLTGSGRIHGPAREAVAAYAYRVAKYIGAYAAVLGGVEALAFTGGVGEHSAIVRQIVCERLGFMGVQVDCELNQVADGKAERSITSDNSRLPVWVIPTDEELEIARQVNSLLTTQSAKN